MYRCPHCSRASIPWQIAVTPTGQCDCPACGGHVERRKPSFKDLTLIFSPLALWLAVEYIYVALAAKSEAYAVAISGSGGFLYTLLAVCLIVALLTGFRRTVIGKAEPPQSLRSPT